MQPGIRSRVLVLLTTSALLGTLAETAAQDYGSRLGTLQRGGEISYAPRGARGVLFGALDPAVRKWYVPQELYAEYAWRQSEYSNYARRHYDRYVDIVLEGDYYYDVWGDFVTRGWLIYNASHSTPQQFGSSVFKANRFENWFNRVVISGDAKGQHQYALTVSNELRTTLTPLTFSKPKWDGFQFDWASDKFEATIIHSRLSAPGGFEYGRPAEAGKQCHVACRRACTDPGWRFCDPGIHLGQCAPIQHPEARVRGQSVLGRIDNRPEQHHHFHRDRAAG